jgi:hypothetical protein
VSVVAPPPHDESELLIREARARQLRRRIAAAAVVAGAGVAAFAIHGALSRGSTPRAGRTVVGVPAASSSCGVRGAGTRILRNGVRVYRDPSPVAMSSTVRCSGHAIWVVFVNGVGMMHEEYVGVRSGDGGRTWRLVFAQQPGVRSQGLDAEVGPWTPAGPNAAYFVGACPACRGFGTLSLSVTKDAGRSFRRYRVPGSDVWGARAIRVHAHRVSIRERRDSGLRLQWRTVTLHVA